MAECESCNGTGQEICNNPDHGFLNLAITDDHGRIGCPCCGHDELHRIPNTVCDECKGKGNNHDRYRKAFKAAIMA